VVVVNAMRWLVSANEVAGVTFSYGQSAVGVSRRDPGR